ncbi:MAG: LysR family transcriptional regulator [Hamadaea sp.]|uniref:LysR substrate-binding domain-containing protein n=1 Tax=Hamadaea sp. TaxID=2024425 RepID=UPI0017CFF947|nr:LysR substrate-binding domain-containing protein [Hamadaea sp.]NUT20447.1 LysR family transcriptional regulator [Hamadaea sp.]
MELRQLEYFVAVAEERNFTRAADRVHVSQSGISAQIRQLEKGLGAQLFDRSGRTATLTVAGKAALEHARAALAAADAVGQAVGEVSDVLRGRLRLGMVVGCTVTPLFEAVAAFHRAHPGVELALTEDSSDRMTDGVRTGELDAALIGAAGAPPSGVESLTVVSEPLVAVVPAKHPLAHQRKLSVRALCAYPLICMPQGTGLRAVLDGACAAHGLAPSVVVEAGAADAIADLATRGLGVGVLSQSMATRYPLTARVVADIETPAVLALIWRASPPPAVRRFVAHTRTAFGAGR